MDAEKTKELQRTMQEAGETKGQYAHVLPDTCRQVAEALGEYGKQLDKADNAEG